MLYKELTGEIIEAAMNVHSTLGAGLFEEVYKVCLRHELTKRGIKVFSEVALPVIYDGVKLDIGYRIDLLVEDNIIVELKSAERIAPVHKAQLLTYLKLAGLQVGLLLNFNVPHLKDGILRIANTLSPSASTAYSAL
jgi:GxxExxY protein